MLQADPAQLRWLAHQFSAASDEIRRKAMAVERVSDDVTGGTSGWKGEAAQGFVRRVEFLANEVRDSVKDFATIADALQTLAHRVELIQGKQQHLQNLQNQRNHLHFGLDLQVDAEIAWLDGQIWALEAEISADRLYADMAAATAFRGVQIREAFEEIWESVKQVAPGVLAKIKDELEDIKDTAIAGVIEVAKDVGDFAEGFAATYLQNASMGLADPLHEDNPEARSDWYKAGRIAGDVAATVQGAAEMIIGGGEVAAGGAEAIVASPTVVLSAVGVGAAVAGGSAVAHGWTTFDEATGKFKDDWSLFEREGSSAGDDFVGTLKGEEVRLEGVKVKEIDYTKRNPEETAQLRKEFDSSVRKKYLQGLASDPAKVEQLCKAGLTESDLARMQDGLNPKGWQVHHKLPLDDGGTNALDNLILIKNDPYHKAITNAQNALTRDLKPGETKKIDWPIPEGPVYPPEK